MVLAMRAAGALAAERAARNLSPGLPNGNPMPIFRDAPSFLHALPATGALLALDVSPRRVGLAGTDAGRRLVTPLRTLMRRRLAADLDAIAEIARRRETVGLVLGWPLNMDGSEGPACQRVKSFAQELLRRLPLPLLLQDERLSTVAVAPEEPGRGGAGPRDHLAAAVILEDALRVMAAATRS
jgi:putative Holliday junction resolvase